MSKQIKFIFDLDGTVTAEETLPLIAKHFNIEAEIEIITKETIQGNIPFIESFIRRVHILGRLPVSKISRLLETAKLYPLIVDFIQKNKEFCAIATGNLECWVDKLSKKIGCELFCSAAISENDKVVQITQILRKEFVVENFQNNGYKVIYIGDGNNDMEAMRIADIAIAAGMTHHPSKSLLPICNYLIFNEKALCRQLNQLF
ncbi:MAG: HAD-IB family phosphatase [Prevotellaceae bacterium]|jgi:HAD superfamily phosphoserine phosphatase-like hydrolase|nr:HAD-IB family phosphatase [Prevotellaceae bacterium]